MGIDTTTTTHMVTDSKNNLSGISLGFTCNLIQKLEDSRRHIDRWVEREKGRADDMEAQFQRTLARQKHNTDRLKTDLLTIELELGAKLNENNKEVSPSSSLPPSGIAKRRQVLEKQEQSMLEDINKLKGKVRDERQNVLGLENEETQAKSRALEVRELKDKAEESKKTTLDDLTRGIVNYKYLGLDFEKAENERLRFSFTQIDEQDPNRQFSFLLYANDFDNYEVEGCTPPIRGKELRSLTDRLNQTDDLASFVRNIRKAFLETF